MRIVFLILAFTIFAACSHKPMPEWKDSSFTQLENFKQTYLAGKENFAKLHFNKAIEQIKLSGSIKTLCRAYLLKCAVERANLDEPDFSKAIETLTLAPDEENRAYLDFITDGTAGEKDIPGTYSGFLKALKSADVAQITKEIESIDDPLSRLIASSIAVKKGLYDSAMLRISVDTASRNGWMKSYTAYSVKLIESLEKLGKTGEADNIRKQLDYINEKPKQ